MKLKVYNRQELIHELNLGSGKTYIAGRKEGCDILLDKIPGISRKHFEISEQQPGVWLVQVLSKVMLVEHEDEERDEFTIAGSGQFTLHPYIFQYEIADSLPGPSPVTYPKSHLEDQYASEDNSEDLSELAVINQDGENLAEANSPGEDFDGNDEKTAIQNFSGVPYMKIIGQNGKKSEYFRLEGNLWVVGGDENASIFIKDPNAAKNHFEISKTDKGYFIVDSGSGQGTELNGQRLNANKASRLLSGDIVTVGETSLQFELRDQAFQRKVSNIPLNLYKNPLVFFDQEVAMVSLDDTNDSSGQAEVVSQDLFSDPKKKKKFILAALAIVLVGAVIAKEFIENANRKDNREIVTADPFSQLSPAEQKIVIQTHRLAKQLYLSGNFELALVQLEKLHSIIPSYKDSQEIEEYCINSRDIRRQQAAIEQQRKEKAQLEAQVLSLIAQCHKEYQNSQDTEGIKACLAPALDLDPNNPAISQLISEVSARAEEQKIRQKIAQEQADKIRRGKELFEKAKALHQGQDFHKAMEAYENHIHSGLPDPSNLVQTSKRKLATIEKKIRTEKQKLIQSAQGLYGNTKLKEAILTARMAQKVDPYDPKISTFIYNAERELTGQMRNIYMDSIIEERFGNLESSRLKWEEIVRLDVPDGEYFKKSKRKLRQYGYHY